MGRLYYRQYGRREAPLYNDKGKLLKISYCETLDLKDLGKQKKIYLAELDEINKILVSHFYNLLDFQIM